MVPQNLITALPFWDKMEKQTFRQSFGAGLGDIECRYDRMLPFTVMHTPIASPNFIYLVRKDGLRAINIGALISVTTATHDGKGYLYYAAGTDHNQSTSITEYSGDTSDNPTTWDVFGSTTWANWVCDGGEYYLEISIGLARYYSELMRISDFPEQTADPTNENLARVRIEGTNLCVIGDLPAALNVNKIFLDAKTSDPQYEIEREVAKDGQEEEFAVWAKMKKRYNITFHAIESVVDWLHSLVLYGDNVSVLDQYGFQASISDIEIKTTWPEDFDGWLARVDFSYSISYFSATGCC